MGYRLNKEDSIQHKKRGETQMEKDYYVFTRHFKKRVHPLSLFSTQVLPGIIAYFGEPKSKFKSKRYNLVEVKICKKLYSSDKANFFWRNFHVKYINSTHKGKKLPLIYKVIGNSRNLIKDGYIVICEPNLEERNSFTYQQSYTYWLKQFYINGSISGDDSTLNQSVSILLNKIHTSPKILKSIPTSDWRIFEEIVAEIYNGFGYEVVLTKKTKDGGKDVIALQRNEEGINKKIFIECKHWKDTIDVKPVRELLGVGVVEDGLTGVILATTSTFTEDAKEFKDKIDATNLQVIRNDIITKLDFDLKDYNDILNWIGDYNAIEFKSNEIKNIFKI